MGALKRVAIAAALVAAPCVAALPATAAVGDWRPFVAEASLRFGVPVAWIERVMRAESGGRTSLGGRPITSPKGAMGLMQLMPGTWAMMRGQLALGSDPYDPHDNIIAGTAYLRLLYDRFGYPGLFAAYNAGPGRYADYLAGRPLPGETRAYVASITGTTDRPAAPSASPLDRLFATKNPAAPQPDAPNADPQPAGLFALRRN